MHFKRQSQRDAEVNMTPLIDVVFLLLIFFMVSTTFTDKTELAIDLPEATARVQLKKADAIEIVVSRVGDYVINGQRLLNNQTGTLKSAVSKIAKGETERPFVITADALSPHESVVRVMDVAGQLGFKNLTITSIEPNG